MKKFNFKNGKEKLVEKANNVKEKCVGYVDDHSEILVFAVVLGAGIYGVWLGNNLRNIYDKGYDKGLNTGLNIYNNMMKELTEMSKESN